MKLKLSIRKSLDTPLVEKLEIIGVNDCQELQAQGSEERQ